ncbi:MAG: hypothetical protein Q7S54_01450 [bacterium]|nr:hypothetical protein [bacterium]
MNEDDIIKDDETEETPPLDELEGKKKPLLDDEVESLDELEAEELEVDKEDLMDDVEEM